MRKAWHAPKVRAVRAVLRWLPLGQARAQSTQHKVDGVSPSITTGGVTLTSTPINNFYTADNANNKINVKVTFDEVVKVVSGTPQLTLKLGSTNKNAAYTRGTGTANLVFEYTVVAGDNDPNGISIQSLSGNIEDDAGNAAILTGSHSPIKPPHKVDTSVPRISGISITSTPGSESTYRAGESIQARVSFSESVNVTGTRS